MSTAPVLLLNVPIAAGLRTMLRVYALPEIAEPEVEVRYFRQPDSSGPRLDLAIYLHRVDRIRLRRRSPSEPWNHYPSMAEVPSIEAFPELAGEGPIWVEVAPMTPGLRIWALMSVTSNTTQVVTLIAPQQ